MRRHGRCSIGGRRAFVGVGCAAVGVFPRGGVRGVACRAVGVGLGRLAVVGGGRVKPSPSAPSPVVSVFTPSGCASLRASPRRSSFRPWSAPASFGNVEPEIPPLPSFPRSPGEKGDGSLRGPLASAKGAGSQDSGFRARPLAGDRAGAGSLTGAVRLSNGNAGVPRRAQRGRKPRVEQKGKSSLDLDFQYEYGPRKRGPSILSERRAPFRREVSEKLPQG